MYLICIHRCFDIRIFQPLCLYPIYQNISELKTFSCVVLSFIKILFSKKEKSNENIMYDQKDKNPAVSYVITVKKQINNINI